MFLPHRHEIRIPHWYDNLTRVHHRWAGVYCLILIDEVVMSANVTIMGVHLLVEHLGAT
jgi:hypothetical protein